MPPVQRLDTPAYLFCRITLWSLGLPATDRLYTSVISWNPEKCTYKESWSTDMSPTAYLVLAADGVHPLAGLAVLSLVYPGCGGDG